MRCNIHNIALVHEEGGPDKPTIAGRTYCPECQGALMTALDVTPRPKPAVACKGCNFLPGRMDGLCLRCYDKAAPLGYVVCSCGYEKAKGMPCGEPCV